MNNARVTGLRSVELGVTDLTQSAAFYSQRLGPRAGRRPTARPSTCAATAPSIMP